MKVGHDLTSCTTQVEPVVIDTSDRFPSLKNHRTVAVDTPGFNDEHVGDDEIRRRITDWLTASYRKGMILGGIIYLHDISQDKLSMSSAADQIIETFNRLSGGAALDKVVLGTTKWARLSESDGSRRETELKEVHWKSMRDKGSKVLRFVGDKSSAWDIVSVFLKRASERRKEIALQIQDEMAVKRKIIPETNAGKELRFTLAEFLKMQKMAVALEEEMAKGGGSDVDARLAETRQNMDKLTTQIQALKVPLSRRFKRFLGLTVSFQ